MYSANLLHRGGECQPSIVATEAKSKINSMQNFSPWARVSI